MRHLGYLRSLLRGVGVRHSLSPTLVGVPDIYAYHTRGERAIPLWDIRFGDKVHGAVDRQHSTHDASSG